MSDINTAIISGRLTFDPELRYTQSGTAIADFTIANGQKYKDSSEQWQERTAFIGCSVFGPMAEFAAKWLRKGNRANVQGQLVTDQWEDKQTGKKKSKTKVKVSQIQPIDWPDKNETQQQAPPQDALRNQSQSTNDDNDDVPF
jgi:single-strand DNA-binding protein